MQYLERSTIDVTMLPNLDTALVRLIYPRYSLVVDENVKKPTNQTTQRLQSWANNTHNNQNNKEQFVIYTRSGQSGLSCNLHCRTWQSQEYYPFTWRGSYLVLCDFSTSSSATRLSRGRVPRLTSDNFTCCHPETEWKEHDFCLSRSYTDTNPTIRRWAPGTGIEPARDLLTRSYALYRLS